MKKYLRTIQGGFASSLIGMLGGLIGLGGAEFRLPVLVRFFKLPMLEAIILNKAISLVVVSVALVFRLNAIPLKQLTPYWMLVLNLLAGSLLGAWWAAGHAITMPRQALNKIIMVILIILALIMLAEASIGLHQNITSALEIGLVRFSIGLLCGFCIGVVAAFLGVAGGELLIPTIVLLYGVDIKLAGSLSLVVSLPTMIVGFIRYSSSDSFRVLQQEKSLFGGMIGGSIVGASLGALMVGVVPTRLLTALLGLVLFISALKMYQHVREENVSR